MLIEHFIYSAALAIIVGMFFSKFTGGDPSWIIIVVALIPDIDFIPQALKKSFGIIISSPIQHGDLHNIIFLVVVSFVISVIMTTIGMRLVDGFLCAVIGIGAHFFEDSLIAEQAYRFFWPFSSEKFGIGIFSEIPHDLFIANSEVFLFGILLLYVCIGARTLIEGRSWWEIFFKAGIEKRNPSEFSKYKKK